MMKKKAIIIPVLSTLLLSGAILTAHVHADDLTTEPSADSSTQSSSLSFSEQTADSGQETSQVSDAISSVAAVVILMKSHHLQQAAALNLLLIAYQMKQQPPFSTPMICMGVS